jgi:hypothetical protein
LTDEEHRLVTVAEQDLDRLLSLQPSPDFAAKVRARVRDDERPAQWRGRWVTGVAVAASIVVIAGIALMVATMRRAPAVKEVPVATEAAVGRDVSLPADKPGVHQTLMADPASRIEDPTAPIPASRSAENAHIARPRSTATAGPPQRTAVPDVLIDPRRRDAMDRLLAMVRSGMTDLPATALEGRQPIVAQDLAVPPVVVEQVEVPLLPGSGGSNESNE